MNNTIIYLSPMIKTLTIALSLGTSFSLYADQVCEPNHMQSTAPSSRYEINPNGTVNDNDTNLVWQVCSISENSEKPKSPTQCNTPNQYTWGEALDYIQKFNSDKQLAGYSDWRLPNIRELATLVELQCFRPAINLQSFPDTPPSHYWSSSPYKFYPHYSWYVNFEDGVYTYGDRTDKKHIRLVRDMQAQ